MATDRGGLRVVPDHIEITGSTHHERVRAISEALQKTNPQSDRRRYNALFDLYLIELHREECRGCCPEAKGARPKPCP